MTNRANFDAATGRGVLRFTAAASAPARAAGPDGQPSRTLAGMAAPYNTPGVATFGNQATRIQIAPGAIAAPEATVPVLRDHDRSRVVGRVTATSASDTGLAAEMLIARTAAGDEVLALAEDGMLVGLSVGLDVTDAAPDDAGVMTVRAARLDELSLTPWPALPGAQLAAGEVVVVVSDDDDDDDDEDEEPDDGADAPDDQEEEDMTRTPTVAAASAPETAAPSPNPVPPTAGRGGPTGTALRASSASAVPRPGEYMSRYIGARLSGDFAEVRRMTAHAAQTAGLSGEALTAAVADQTTDNVTGILPTWIIAPVINERYNKRPLWNSLVSREMPAKGKVFERPRITTHVGVDKQTADKKQLASTAMVVTSDTVTKMTLGGTLDVGFQAIDWTEPTLMDLLVQDFADSYVLATEAQTVTQFAAAVTAGAQTVTADPADPAAVIAAFYSAAGTSFQGFGRFPDTVWASLDQWAALGGLCDKTGRPIFPYLGPTNAGSSVGTIEGPSGTGPLGGRFVLAPTLAAGTLVVGHSEAIETYEQIKGMIQLMNVSQLGMDMAYYGYAAEYTVEPKAFVQITLATPPAQQSASTKG